MCSEVIDEIGCGHGVMAGGKEERNTNVVEFALVGLVVEDCWFEMLFYYRPDIIQLRIQAQQLDPIHIININIRLQLLHNVLYYLLSLHYHTDLFLIEFRLSKSVLNLPIRR